MIIIRRRTIVLFFLIILFLGGFWSAILYQRSRIKIGEHYIRINPDAKINPNKHYRIRLWDYQLPLERSNGYQAYLQRAITDFQKEYPNIKVEIKWLDLLTGEAELREALVHNEAPDLYASFYALPEFYYLRQIPAGPFLTKEDKEIYRQKVARLYAVDGVLCSLPRWASLNIWVGNRKKLESLGVDIAKVQNEGWSWSDLRKLTEKINQDTALMVGSPLDQSFLETLRQTKKPMGEVRSALTTVAAVLHGGGIPENYEQNAIAKFLSGKALLLAGIRPLAYLALQNSGLSDHIQPVVLPAPRLDGLEEIHTVDGGIINIYRNRYTRGDDHLAAAVRFGYYLSTYSDCWPWINMGTLPLNSRVIVKSEVAKEIGIIADRGILIKRKQPNELPEIIPRFLKKEATVAEVIEELNLQ